MCTVESHSKNDKLNIIIYKYFIILLGFQTLGEEYCNIVQVDKSKTRIPSTLVRL